MDKALLKVFLNLIPTTLGQNDSVPHIYPYISQIMTANVFKMSQSFLPVMFHKF